MSDNRKLYVGNFLYTTTEDELRDLFAENGDVRSVRIMTKEEKSLGYGFVEMLSHRDAENAVRLLNLKFFRGRCLRVAFTIPREGKRKIQ